jgi:hypothetical protein
VLPFAKARLQRLLANLQFGDALFQGFACHCYSFMSGVCHTVPRKNENCRCIDALLSGMLTRLHGVASATTLNIWGMVRLA